MPENQSMRVAVVTGASRGIGRAITLEMVRRGFAVAAASRNTTALAELEAEISGQGGKCMTVRCDVSSAADVQSLIMKCEKEFARLDVLVNNAGIGHVVSVENTSEEAWDATMNINLKGAFLCCREALPLFRKSGGGLIINNGSIAAMRGFPNFAAYSASKAGLLGFTRALREELRAEKIRVSIVLPGATDSPFWETVEGTWDRTKMIAAQDVARVVADIADQPASVTTEEMIIMPAGGAL